MKGVKASSERSTSAGRKPRPGQGAKRARPGVAARQRPASARPGVAASASVAAPAAVTGADPRSAVEATVSGLGYELVDLERAGRGLLRVMIDRLPGRAYAEPGDAVTVGDCEQVTRQLQYALEVEGVDYSRLEVSSPGLDRPLRREADYERFAGQAINLNLREPFAGRKHYQGVLGKTEGGWQIVFSDGKAEQVLGFGLDEVREARLVPVLDFKGRKQAEAAQPAPAQARTQAAPAAEVDGEVSR